MSMGRAPTRTHEAPLGCTSDGLRPDLTRGLHEVLPCVRGKGSSPLGFIPHGRPLCIRKKTSRNQTPAWTVGRYAPLGFQKSL